MSNCILLTFIYSQPLLMKNNMKRPLTIHVQQTGLSQTD